MDGIFILKVKNLQNEDKLKQTEQNMTILTCVLSLAGSTGMKVDCGCGRKFSCTKTGLLGGLWEKDNQINNYKLRFCYVWYNKWINQCHTPDQGI